MKDYEVIARNFSLHPGQIVALTKDQLKRRTASVKVLDKDLKGKRIKCQVTSATGFKLGEVISIDVAEKTLLGQLQKVGSKNTAAEDDRAEKEAALKAEAAEKAKKEAEEKAAQEAAEKEAAEQKEAEEKAKAEAEAEEKAKAEAAQKAADEAKKAKSGNK